MSRYQIADLEKLTGIRSHTIRIWEKRYNIINPHRTSTNIRYYDDAQVQKLLKVSTLLGLGLKISRIADMSEKELNAKVLEAGKSVKEDVNSASFINDLISAMLVFDEPGFERALSNAVVKFGMYQAILRVFYPFLKRTGLMWSMAETMPVQEHFASFIIRRKLISAIDGLPLASKKSKIFILFLPPDEWHETGLLLSDYIIRSSGYRTIYLGQSVPLENLKQVVKAVKPTHFFTLYITRKDQEQISSELRFLVKSFPGINILVSGSSLVTNTLAGIPGIQLLDEPDDLHKTF